MLRYKYSYKTRNEGQRNNSVQYHEEFASLVNDSFIANKQKFVDIPQNIDIAIDKVNYHLERQLLNKTNNKKLPNHYLHDELLYSKNAKKSNTRLSYHETEINARLKALAKERTKCKNRDKRHEIDLQVAALNEEKTVLQESNWTKHFLA